MKHFRNSSIDEFRGYLKCLSRLCAKRYIFGVCSFTAESDIDTLVKELTSSWSEGDEFIKPTKYEYLGRERIEYRKLTSEIEKYIFNGILDRKNMPSENAKSYATKMMLEDINEYYGLVSVSLNKKGVFHPLISSDVYRLVIENETHESSLYYIVKIEDMYVLTYFMKKVKIGE